jgi:group I intron endonuclease
MYIYKFTHIDSERCYIGQTIQDPNQRRLEHIADSRHTKRTYHFHNALRKYGVETFTFEVIATASNLDELNLLEDTFILKYNSINNGFNIRKGGSNKLHHEESKRRMSSAQKEAHARRKQAGTDTWSRSDGGAMTGKTHSKETKIKMSKARFGKTHTTETRQLMSETRKGRVTSEETKQKLRERSLESWAKRKQIKD